MTVSKRSFTSGVLGHEELHLDLLSSFGELFPPDGPAVVAKEQVVKREHAHAPLLSAASVLLASPA